ncbi:MAG: toxin-antitoxin system HicB family antitoxin [Candidatus Electrothrix sp. LOE2]|nr:toxin-antitoxin system HicB family antitoxin [Candidatus Electrothrix sp. LOE2]
MGENAARLGIPHGQAAHPGAVSGGGAGSYSRVDSSCTYNLNPRRTPDKPYSGKLTLRIAPSVHAELSAAAAHAGKSLNKWVADTLEQAVHSSSLRC